MGKKGTLICRGGEEGKVGSDEHATESKSKKGKTAVEMSRREEASDGVGERQRGQEKIG